MYSPAALTDLHERTHRSLGRLLEHCASLPVDLWMCPLEGFAYSTVAGQLQHVLEAESYWLGVLQGNPDPAGLDDPAPDPAGMQALAERTRLATRTWLDGVAEDVLNRDAIFATWGGRQRELKPAHVILRVVTHGFHHAGQVQAMCRIMGPPVVALDFPLGSL